MSRLRRLLWPPDPGPYYIPGYTTPGQAQTVERVSAALRELWRADGAAMSQMRRNNERFAAELLRLGA